MILQLLAKSSATSHFQQTSSFLIIVLWRAHKSQTPLPHIWKTITTTKSENEQTTTRNTTPKSLIDKLKKWPQSRTKSSSRQRERERLQTKIKEEKKKIKKDCCRFQRQRQRWAARVFSLAFLWEGFFFFEAEDLCCDFFFFQLLKLKVYEWLWSISIFLYGIYYQET